MKITAFIPIKLNNQRLPGKNLKYLNDQPLIYHIQNTLLKIKDKFDSINVYCSNESITKYILDGINFIKRPQYLDGNEILGNQIYSEFIKNKDSEYYLLCHATTPLIKSDTILDMIKNVESKEYDSAFPAYKIKTFLWSKNKPLNFDVSNIPRTQDLENIYVDKSGPYLFSKELFLKYNRRVGFNPYIREISFKESIDIDTEEDFDLAKSFI